MGTVLEALSGDIELSIGRHDRAVLDGLIRSWRSAEPALRGDMAAEFRSLLRSEDIKQRSAAVLFFATVPADDDGGLLEALGAAPSHFEHVPDPWFGRGELRGLVALALSRRLDTPENLAHVRSEAHRPTFGQMVIPGLLAHDRDWVMDQLEPLLDAVPESLVPLDSDCTDAELERVFAAAANSLRPDVCEGILAARVEDDARRAWLLSRWRSR